MSDKRQFPRIEVKGMVKYRVPENMDISMASLKNISAGGICLLSEYDILEGAKLSIEFGLPGDTKPVIGLGEVRWVERIEPPMGRFRFRIGVQFVKISPDKERAVLDYVVKRLKSQVHDEIIEPDKALPARRRLNMLIIDDDKVVLKLVEDIFADSFHVITANNGYIGIEKAKEWRPDLILLDIIMPDLDGFSTLMLLKDFPETKGIPVIMLSVLREKSKVFQAMQHGASGYILKPFTAESLLRKIRKVIKMNAEEN
ncbi:MAG: response regulator [bacterium]